jgi:hypothetical protein
MKLSEQTLTVLKNFASINSGVVIRSGATQRTMSPEKSVLVEATLEDTFPCQFGIYDLNQFLGNTLALNAPDMDFSDNLVMMKDDMMTVKYSSCNPELIISPPNKELVLTDPEVKFDLSQTIVNRLLRLASMNNLPHLSFVVKSGELSVMVHDKANNLSNYASIRIGDHAGEDMIATFKTENIKMIPDDYSVEVKLGKFATFVSKTKNLKYFIVVESK